MDRFEVTDRGITYLIEEVEEGGYFGQVIELPACLTEGTTVDETIANLREALTLYLEMAREENIEVPIAVQRALAATA